jgi:GNAT superfamily N-acetyltransferase
MTPKAEIVEVTTPEQLGQVRTLIRSYQSELSVQYRFPDSEWQNLPGGYRPPGGALLLATVAGEPAGCVGLRPFPLDGACEMKRLYVRPKFRGDKLGGTLIEQIIQAARCRGYTRMRLDTHPPTMGTAVELYRRFGFAEVPAGPGPQVDGLLYMELCL